MSSDHSLEARVARLERQNRRLRNTVVGCIVLLCAWPLLGATQKQQIRASKIVADEILLRKERQPADEPNQQLEVELSQVKITARGVDVTVEGTMFAQLYDGKTLEQRAREGNMPKPGQRPTYVKTGRYLWTNSIRGIASHLEREPKERGAPFALGPSEHVITNWKGVHGSVLGGGRDTHRSFALAFDGLSVGRAMRDAVKVGEVELTSASGVETKYPLGSITLFDDKGNVTWRAPRR